MAPESSFSHFKNNTNKLWIRDPALRINVLHCIGLYFCVFYLGYDASLLNGLQAMPQWQSYFNHPDGNYLGLISASLFLPAIITPYISSWINGRWGRKVALSIGSLIIILGSFINAFANSSGMFIAGRVLIGGAGPFGKITAVALLQEIAHPRLRAVLASSFYCNYYLGSTAAAWFCFGSLNWRSTSWSWRAPCLFQAFAPTVVLIFLWFIPESPRWLVHHNEPKKALGILTKYHANSAADDELVKYEFQEIQAAIELEKINAKTRYTDFVKGGANRRRLLVLVTMATGTNWVGNGVITYYLAPVLTLIGITDAVQISGINCGLAIWNLFLAYGGALNAERLGRRKLWLISTTGMLLSYIVITALSGSFEASQTRSIGIAVVPFLFIFYGFYDIGWTPLPFSYGAEILPYHMRLKGLSILLSTQSVAQAFNQWVNPVALDAIQWKYYIVYIALLCVYLTLVILFFPETKGHTIEAVSLIFDTGRLGNASMAEAELQAHTKTHEVGDQKEVSAMQIEEKPV